MKIGILGGGQLLQMLALAGMPLGHRCVFFDPAILKMPLGQTDSLSHCAMINYIGQLPIINELIILPAAHDYDKKPRPGRKLGH